MWGSSALSIALVPLVSPQTGNLREHWEFGLQYPFYPLAVNNNPAPSLNPTITPYFICCSFCLTGEWGLEVCGHGDWSSVSLDLCVCVCLWHNRNVPSASLPKLHSQNYHQHTRLTNHHPPPHQWTLPTISCDGRAKGGGGVCRRRGQMSLWTNVRFIRTVFGISHRVGI